MVRALPQSKKNAAQKNAAQENAAQENATHRSEARAKDALPRTIKPRELVAREARLEGSLSLQDCSRLESLAVGDGSGDVSVALEFARNSAGEQACTGRVEVALVLECQRCLEPVLTQIVGQVRAEFVAGEGDPQAEGFEAVNLADETLCLSDFIEDEILLALPFAPSHDVGGCAVEEGYDGSGAQLPEERVNPFAQLRSLLDKKP